MSTFASPTDVLATALARSANVNDLDAATATAFALLPDETLLKNGTVNFVTSTGTANAYIVTLAAAPASYVNGLLIVFKANHTNTGAATVNVNSLGVKSLAKHDASALETGDLTMNLIYAFRYNSTSAVFELQTAALSEIVGTGTVTVSLSLDTDASPALGGDLNVGGYDIISSAGVDITLTPGTGGEVVLPDEFLKQYFLL